MTDLHIETRTVAADDGTELGLYVARPNGQARGALIVLQEVFGVNDHVRDLTRRFAEEGYLCAAPDLFHRTGEWFEGSASDFKAAVARAQATTQPNIRSDLRATHDFLREEVSAARKIGAVGFCMGGRQAFVANGILPLSCAISFYGSNVAGLPDLAPTQSGPAMFLWGARDAHIDLAQRRTVVDLFTAAQKPYVDITFGDADHGFFRDGSAQYHEPSARQAWALVRAFLDVHLA
jgi:carboxymethylenebutenolidase